MRSRFALGNPEFVADHIEALFLVQGPFGGTGVADYLVGEGPPIDSRMPWRHRVVAHVLGRLEVFLLDRGKHGGLQALTQRSSDEFWERALEEHQAAIPVVSPRTFYVTTPDRALAAPTLPASDRVVPGLPGPERWHGRPGRPDRARPGNRPGGPRRRAHRPDEPIPVGPLEAAPAKGVDRRDRHGRRRKICLPLCSHGGGFLTTASEAIGLATAHARPMRCYCVRTAVTARNAGPATAHARPRHGYWLPLPGERAAPPRAFSSGIARCASFLKRSCGMGLEPLPFQPLVRSHRL